MAFIHSFTYTVLLIATMVPSAIYIFKFFDVEFEVYGNYLLFGVALALFNTMLPYEQKNIFSTIK
jgi:hypothetical protein